MNARTAGTSSLAVPHAKATDAAVSPRRILYIEQNVDGTTGGSYRSLLYLLKGLDRRSYTPIVCFYREHELLDEYRAAGCRTLRLSHPTPVDLVTRVRRGGPLARPLAPAARLAQRALNLFRVSGSLMLAGVRLMLKERIDILHLNNGVTVGLELLIASKMLGMACIIHQRGISRVPRWCMWLANRADHVIGVSDAARQNLIVQGLRPERCTAIHNGISIKELQRTVRRCPGEVRAALGIGRDTIIVGLAGMIRRWKGQIVLVRAMARIHRRYPDVRALIMGGLADNDPSDLAYRREIEACIAEHNLAECVTVLDYQPNAPEFLQIFDVMVHAAVEPEPFSRVVIEGMALGRAIVASANGGTPEAIEHETTGLLFPSNDSDALAEQVERLIDDAPLRERLGRAAREKVHGQFLIETHVARTEAIYASLFTSAGARS
jgi:glycosyltransferase involved in cell wall biosynthesis